MIFVTGGTGLLGSHLLQQLTFKGEKVRAIYRDKSKIQQVKQLFDFYKYINENSMLFIKFNIAHKFYKFTVNNIRIIKMKK